MEKEEKKIKKEELGRLTDKHFRKEKTDALSEAP